MVVKPLEGRGGEGIFLARAGDPNLGSILEQATRFGTQWTLAQRFLPDVEKGDKRILLLEGEVLGAVNRVPARDEVRANLHVGGRPAAAEIGDAEHRIVERIAPRLREDGFFFVGIDVIGGYLTEINVTSPTGIQEASRLSGENLSARVIDALERLLTD
jgi:glutathione synthase